jgi:hypothetical protein
MGSMARDFYSARGFSKDCQELLKELAMES